VAEPQGVSVSETPPPVLDRSFVQEYARLDAGVPWNRQTRLYVDGVLVEWVPGLAIALSLDAQGRPVADEFLLLHCDNDWNSVGVIVVTSVDEAKRVAEHRYPGSGGLWLDAGYDTSHVAQHFEDAYGSLRCSFCRRSPYEFRRSVQGRGAVICDDCLGRLAAELAQEAEDA